MVKQDLVQVEKLGDLERGMCLVRDRDMKCYHVPAISVKTEIDDLANEFVNTCREMIKKVKGHALFAEVPPLPVRWVSNGEWTATACHGDYNIRSKRGIMTCQYHHDGKRTSMTLYRGKSWQDCRDAMYDHHVKTIGGIRLA
jgi:hypothetical protein